MAHATNAGTWPIRGRGMGLTNFGLKQMLRRIRHVAEPGERLVDYDIGTSRAFGVEAPCRMLVGERAFYCYNEPPRGGPRTVIVQTARYDDITWGTVFNQWVRVDYVARDGVETSIQAQVRGDVRKSFVEALAARIPEDRFRTGG